MHACFQERRAFGPLGWNVGYHFSESDLEASIALLRSLFSKHERPEDFDFVPLQYLVGNVNYGGRITDDWDRRCLENLLALYVSPEVILEVDSLSHLGKTLSLCLYVCNPFIYSSTSLSIYLSLIYPAIYSLVFSLSIYLERERRSEISP